MMEFEDFVRNKFVEVMLRIENMEKRMIELEGLMSEKVVWTKPE